MDQIKSTYNTIYDPFGYTPVFQIILAFVFGVILSPFSYGIIFLVVFLLIFELCFAVQYNYNPLNAMLRPGLILWALFGFLLGRTLVCEDWNPIRRDYNEEDELKNHFDDINEDLKDNHNDNIWR